MKTEEIQKFGKISIALVFMIMVSLSLVKAIGVTRPVPQDLELMRGESANFVFEIQAVTSTERTECTYSLTNMDPLIVEFKDDVVRIEAGEIEEVYGTVTVPEGTPFKTYSSELSVSCGGVTEGEETGSSVKTTIGSSPFSVRVVEFREKDIKNVGEPEEGLPWEIIIIVGSLIIISVFLYYKKKKKK